MLDLAGALESSLKNVWAGKDALVLLLGVRGEAYDSCDWRLLVWPDERRVGSGGWGRTSDKEGIPEAGVRLDCIVIVLYSLRIRSC